jgi:hypothetical protein
VKYAWIDAQRREYPLPDMCEVLAVSISATDPGAEAASLTVRD